MDKPLWGLRVLKFNGAIAPRVLKFDGAFGPEGCGIALRAMSIKSALRDLLSVPYGMINILQWKTIQPRLQCGVGLFSLG